MPIIVAAVLECGGAVAILLVLAGIAVYLLFWIALAALVGRLRWNSVANTAALAAAWLVLVLIVPTLANVLINQAIPVDQGHRYRPCPARGGQPRLGHTARGDDASLPRRESRMGGFAGLGCAMESGGIIAPLVASTAKRTPPPVAEGILH